MADTSISRAISLYDAFIAAKESGAIQAEVKLGYSAVLAQSPTISVIRGQGRISDNQQICTLNDIGSTVIVELQAVELLEEKGTDVGRRNAYLSLHQLADSAIPVIRSWVTAFRENGSLKQYSILIENDADTTTPVYKAEVIITEDLQVW